jgi:hypothetical protein
MRLRQGFRADLENPFHDPEEEKQQDDQGDYDDKISWFLEDHFKYKSRAVDPLEGPDRKPGKELVEIRDIGSTDHKSDGKEDKNPVEKDIINPFRVFIYDEKDGKDQERQDKNIS